MATVARYAKPSLTNLPKEIGIPIFRQIVNTPAPARKKMKAESDALLKAMVAERDKEDASGNTSKGADRVLPPFLPY